MSLSARRLQRRLRRAARDRRGVALILTVTMTVLLTTVSGVEYLYRNRDVWWAALR